MKMWLGCLVMAALAATSATAQEFRKVGMVETTTWINAVSVCGSSGLATGLAEDGSIYVWKLPAGEAVSNHPVGKEVKTISCSRDGKWLALGMDDGFVEITDISGKPVRRIAIGKVTIADVIYSPDSSLLGVRLSGAPAQLWDPNTGTLVGEMKTDFGGSTAMDFSSDSSLFATSDGDTAIRIYDRGGKLKATYTGMLLEPFGISFLPGGTQLVVGGADSMLTIVDGSDGHMVRQLAKLADPVIRVISLSDGNLLMSIHIDGVTLKKQTALLWDIRTGARREISMDAPDVVGYANTPDGKGLVFTADSKSSMTIWTFSK
jgi:WD40 repeat protein